MAPRQPLAARSAAPGRSGSRPAGRANQPKKSAGSAAKTSSATSTRTAKAGDGEPPEPRQLTLRTAIFGMVLLVAFIVLAPTMRAYISQQEQLRDLNTSLAQTQSRVEALEAELARWSDPEYIKSQARDRFSFVAPGETAYRVIDPETVTGEDPMADLTQAAANQNPATIAASTTPWYLTMWDSVEVAGAAHATAQSTESESGQPESAPSDPAASDPAASDPAASDPAASNVDNG